MRIESLRRPLWVAGGLFLAAAALLTALYLARGWRHTGAPASQTDDAARLQAAQAASQQHPSDDAVIWRRMGTQGATAQPKAAPRADPGFEVMATFYESDQQFCQAILRDRTHRQYLVSVGEAVQGCKVARIATDSVTLNIGGTEVQLPLRSAQPGAPSTPVAPVASGYASAPAYPPAASSSAPAPAASAEGADHFVVTHEQLQFYVKRLINIMAQVELAPQKDERGTIIGLRIARMDKNALASRRGFQEGDLVKNVLGTPLSDPQQIPELAQRIFKAPPRTVTVIIERGGQEQKLLYEIE